MFPARIPCKSFYPGKVQDLVLCPLFLIAFIREGFSQVSLQEIQVIFTDVLKEVPEELLMLPQTFRHSWFSTQIQYLGSWDLLGDSGASWNNLLSGVYDYFYKNGCTWEAKRHQPVKYPQRIPAGLHSCSEQQVDDADVPRFQVCFSFPLLTHSWLFKVPLQIKKHFWVALDRAWVSPRLVSPTPSPAIARESPMPRSQFPAKYWFL